MKARRYEAPFPSILVMLCLSGCGAPTAASSLPSPTTLAPTSAAVAPSAEPVPATSVAAEVHQKPPRVETVPQLARFYAGLRGLEDKSRKSHVRIYWMGDSHAQADFWSGALRDKLQARFGNAGPGFLHLGYKKYRHDWVKLVVDGSWRMRPKKPAGTRPEDDGVFGLGGLMLSGYEGAPKVTLNINQPPPGLNADLCYRLKKKTDAVRVELGGKQVADIVTSGSEPPGLVHHWTGKTQDVPTLSFAALGGQPEFCGLDLETDPTVAPGVVLDTLGINGAKYATALSWDEAAWEAEAKRRPPDLIVFEYGTNEAGDATTDPEKVGKNADAMLARVKTANPEADCVIVSATDRVDAGDRVMQVNQRLQEAATRLGCFYFDAHKVLGGKGAMAKLRDEPDPKVQKDGIHLTLNGYREIGATMFDALMAGY